MERTIPKLHKHIDSILAYLKPLLPLANCHMVVFFTNNLWECLLPCHLKEYLNNCELSEAVDQFWKSAQGNFNDKTELSMWVQQSKCHSIKINNEYYLSTNQLQEHIKSWGGEIKPPLQISEFMNSKKSYEVQTMSHLAASLFTASNSTHCVEAGGGRGHLLVALSLAYNLPSLTIDCDEKTIDNAQKRVKMIQKQWHAIAKGVDGDDKWPSNVINTDLHRFAATFITQNTNLVDIVKEKFPDYSTKDINLLLTGLHTCGNLGPASLRMFLRSPRTGAMFTVPCCYHLLSEDVNTQLFDVFQRNFEDESMDPGFPMSDRLRGFKLGRNARMLAAQSIDRVVHHQQLPDKSLLYRALLQVIIKNHSKELPVFEGKLKGIGSKCQNFDEYFKKADSILKLELYDKLSENDLADIEKNINYQWKKIVLFYLIRLCLAQVVESVILLDRLLYLYENGFEKCYLVKLFDPVLSPRCNAIVVLR